MLKYYSIQTEKDNFLANSWKEVTELIGMMLPRCFFLSEVFDEKTVTNFYKRQATSNFTIRYVRD